MDDFGPSPLSQVLTVPGALFAWGAFFAWASFLIYRYREDRGLVGVIAVAVFTRVLFVAVNTYYYTIPVDPFESIAAEATSAGAKTVMANFGFGYHMYLSFCSVVYLMVGRNPLILQFINVAMVVHSIVLLTRIVMLRAGKRSGFWIGVFLAIMPTFIVFGSVIIRDAMIIYLLTGMIWFLANSYRLVFTAGVWLSGLCVLGVLTLHVCGSALMVLWVLIISFLVIGALFRRGGGLHRYEWGHAFLAVLVAVIGLNITFAPSGGAPSGAGRTTETGVRRMLGMTGADHSKVKTITLAGESVVLSESRGAYLMDIDNSSTKAKIIDLPRRATYFLFAPFPWKISNMKDFIGFFDSLIQLSIVGSIFWLAVKREFSVRFVIEVAIYSMLVAGFSLAVSNYGTAARHRLKLLVPGVPIVALALNSRRKKKHDEVKPITP